MSNEETARLRSEIFQRRAQLRDLLAEDEVDIAQVKAVQGEINRLEREMAERRSNMNSSRGSGWLPRLLNRWR
jgi:capsule polysaccharide export protein KpsE/RkpR